MPDQFESVEDLLLDIIYFGIMRIRRYASQGQCEKCHDEAIHIHNLPSMVINPTLDQLSSYYDIGRVVYIESTSDTRVFEPHWAQLKKIIEQMRRTGSC